ncbi:DUF397 domain-containing protein [Streptomyces sp. JJ66]|uniref:DUF397 domain-containing protein n=1 Tax=Streptomyces sp. JJ66 TaxID=2803843 RepID=UPI001C572959|nr:DUF397 domain-containing protein [Streptomyces sp. JJ66]MBW1602541.1 DUF397 domain-containing protein [Streptomyces sp. JJ66]
MTVKQAQEAGARLEWTKSSYSSNDGPDCVEVAASPAAVHVRDSKHVSGPHLTLPPAAWTDFVTFSTQA